MILLLAPVLILICVLSIYPILRGIAIGFTDYRVGRNPAFNGVANYVGIYEGGYLFITLKNIGYMMAVSLIVTYLFSMTLALVLNTRIPLRGLCRTLLIIPWAVPPIAKIAMWRTIFNPLRGHLNYVLTQLGIISRSISWVSEIDTAIYTVICVLVWGCIPFVTLSLLATLQQIPNEIAEAAILDGVGRVQYFFHIVLPYLRKTTVMSMSLIAVWIMNDFASQSLLTRGGPGSATLTPTIEAYRQGFRFGNLGYASAYGNIMILIVSILLFFYVGNMNLKDTGVN